MANVALHFEAVSNMHVYVVVLWFCASFVYYITFLCPFKV